MLANTADFLNKSLISIGYYQKELRINPDNREEISNLGWMLYKVHRLTEGEKLLTDAIGRIGEEADFSMTLGTIYSEMYNYDKSKYWYQKAIEQGMEIGDMSFAAVAHYNLSILESRFYHYDLSMIETNASLNARRRASGLLARGELNMNRLELRQSQADYEAAYELDTSPLAKLNLAQIYQISGRLEEASLYAEDCLKANDHSWMLNYGIDPDRYKRDIHEILSDTYKGLAAVEAASPWARPGEKIRSLAKRIIYSFKAAVHVRLYEKYSLAAADSYRAELSNESPVLDMVTQYFNSFKRYPFRARTYLRYARSLETQIIPESEPSYDLDEGTLNKDIRALERALAGFDPHWEKILISQCYQEIAGLSRGLPRTERQFAAEELFSLNRGGLRQAGLALPVALEVQYTAESIPGAREGKALQKNLYKALGKTGFRIANDDTKETPRFTLRLLIDGSAGQGFSVQCELVDTQGAGETIRRDFPLKDFSRPGISDFCRTLGNVVFVVD
ncbi:MAG: hypothetical protein FWF29_00985, partial [Treponema sp.]|nr:hypothetical protein [Treponema sp.]